MIPFRVTLEFQQPGRPPTQETTEHLLGRLRAAAPDGHAALEPGIGRFHAALTVLAADADEAAAHAVAAARQVFARAATRIDVQPQG